LLGFSVKLSYIISYVVYALGIPGNILSVIVWLRHHITSEGPAALYLAALAINDLVFVAFDGVDTILERYGFYYDHWLRRCTVYLLGSTAALESLLVLSFSVVRIIAIRRPLQVCRITMFHRKLSWRRETAQRSVYE